jgi:hypothetical protein
LLLSSFQCPSTRRWPRWPTTSLRRSPGRAIAATTSISPRPTATIAAQVFDHRGTVTLIVAVHPLAVHPRLDARAVAAAWRRLLRATTAIGAEG